MAKSKQSGPGKGTRPSTSRVLTQLGQRNDLVNIWPWQYMTHLCFLNSANGEAQLMLLAWEGHWEDMMMFNKPGPSPFLMLQPTRFSSCVFDESFFFFFLSVIKFSIILTMLCLKLLFFLYYFILLKKLQIKTNSYKPLSVTHL